MNDNFSKQGEKALFQSQNNTFNSLDENDSMQMINIFKCKYDVSEDGEPRDSDRRRNRNNR